MVNQQMYALGANRSVIRELFEYGKLRAAVVGAENVFDYSLGNPSIPAPEEVNTTIRTLLEDTDSVQLHGYTSAAGDMQTRQAIAAELRRRYCTDIDPERLFVGCGAAAELVSVMRALTVPGAEILAIAPYFPEYKPFAEQAGAVFKTVSADTEYFQIDFQSMEQQITANTVAVIVNSPNNPSGAVYTEQTLRQLSQLLREKAAQYGHPVYILADEPYRELVYDGVRVPFIPDIYPDTVVCYSYSKSLSLPGERIGYIYVPPQAADSEALYKAILGAARVSGHVCAPSLMQKVIARCVHLRPDLKAYDKNRKALYEGLLDAGYQVVKPEGAFYLFVKAPGGDAVAFSQRAKEKDLLVVPGDGFGCPGYFRLCYCVSYDTILRSLPVFRQLNVERAYGV